MNHETACPGEVTLPGQGRQIGHSALLSTSTTAMAPIVSVARDGRADRKRA